MGKVIEFKTADGQWQKEFLARLSAKENPRIECQYRSRDGVVTALCVSFEVESWHVDESGILFIYSDSSMLSFDPENVEEVRIDGEQFTICSPSSILLVTIA